MPGEIGQGFVVIHDGAQLIALGSSEIALEIEHEASGTEPHFQPFLLGLELFLGHDPCRLGGLDAFKVRLDAAHRLTDPDNDLLTDIRKRDLGVPGFKLPFIVGAEGGTRASGEDKAILLRIAEAWDEQARAAGQAAIKADGNGRPVSRGSER